MTAALSSLQIGSALSPWTLNPAFAMGITSYEVSLTTTHSGYGMETSFTYQTLDPNATVSYSASGDCYVREDQYTGHTVGIQMSGDEGQGELILTVTGSDGRTLTYRVAISLTLAA